MLEVVARCPAGPEQRSKSAQHQDAALVVSGSNNHTHRRRKQPECPSVLLLDCIAQYLHHQIDRLVVIGFLCGLIGRHRGVEVGQVKQQLGSLVRNLNVVLLDHQRRLLLHPPAWPRRLSGRNTGWQ